jgi:hypothetical protein
MLFGATPRCGVQVEFFTANFDASRVEQPDAVA